MPIIKLKATKNSTLGKIIEANGIPPEKAEKSAKLGGILVNGKRVKNLNHKVKRGDKISVCVDEKPPEAEFSEKWIRFIDNYLMALNKPQGITTQGTMCFDVNHLYYFAKQYANGYVGLHHRLDRDTSGLVLFTLSKKVNKPIGLMFKEKKIKKTYYAIVHGVLKKETEINVPIGKIPQSEPVKWWVNMPQSKQAITKAIPCKTIQNKFTLAKLIPLTGRTHQLRIHLASIGHPIVGDKFYNPEETEPCSLMLHCKTLEFIHPKTGKQVKIDTELPERFENFIKRKEQK